MKKKTIAICSAVTAAVVLAVTVGILLPRNDKTVPATESGRETAETSTVETAVSVPDEIGAESEAAVSVTDVSDVDSLLTIDDPEPVSSKPSVSRETSSAPAPAKPITVKTPTDDGDGGNGGITIGGAQPLSTEKYDCGTPGHHCAGPETHAYLLNLELEGCPYCGKHDCPSFYAVDEWGNTCYTPSKCPEYSAHKDPVYYCQTCGRKCGDGSGETCVQFIHACNCPNCGEWVEARTCHNCK